MNFDEIDQLMRDKFATLLTVKASHAPTGLKAKSAPPT